MTNHKISSYITDILPVCFNKFILELSSAGCSTNRCVRLKEVYNVLADEFKISVCNQSVRIETDFSDKLFDGLSYWLLLQVFHSNNDFITRCLIHEKDGIMYTANCSVVTIHDIVCPGRSVFFCFGTGLPFRFFGRVAVFPLESIRWFPVSRIRNVDWTWSFRFF